MKSNRRFKKQLQISLGTKITLAMTGLVLFSTIVASHFFLNREREFFDRELEQKSDILLTALTASNVKSWNYKEIKAIHNTLIRLRRQNAIVNGIVYNSTGRAIAKSGIAEDEKSSNLEQLDSWGEQIIASKTTVWQWHSDSAIVGKSIFVDDKIVAAIAIELSTIPPQHKLAKQKRQILFPIAILTILTSIVGYYWSRSVTEPLKQIITATQYLASGALDCQIDVKSNDEFAILAKTFNFMTSELNKTVRDLQFRAEALHLSETEASDRALELKKTLEELENAKAIAEKANRAKSTFLSSMSHELRTPLNGILGYTQILLRDRTLDDKQQNGLKIIYDSGNHLLTLINDILDLSKIEARKLELYPTDLHCESFFNSIGDIIRLQAIEKSIRFECVLSDNLPLGIRADEKRLRQILLNLLGNSVKFTDKGKVSLQVISLPKNIFQDPNQQTLRFQVIDTGVGMTSQQLMQIFQPFEQVGDIKKRAGGTGLGLAIVMNLVTLMGGEIKVRSKPNRGSKFWFDLTFKTVQTAKIRSFSEPKRQIVSYRGRKRTILVVDDKEENRSILLNLLQPLGFQIVLGENGQQEVALAQKIKPDCILTDLVMPIKNGFEAVKEIRNIPSIKDTIVIAISASVSQSDRDRSRLAGCQAFLAKPFRQEELLSLLQQYLHLTWIYEPIGSDRTTAKTVRASLSESANRAISLPPEEVEILYELAMLGSMKKIRERADYLEELDETYAPLAQQLRYLAQGFKEKAILDLIEQYV